MNNKTKKTMYEDLAFLSKMVKKHKKIPVKYIYNNYLMHQKTETMGNYIAQFGPLLGPLADELSQFMKNAFKAPDKPPYFDISIGPEIPAHLPKEWEHGDEVTLVLGKDVFKAIMHDYLEEEKCYYGLIMDELNDTVSHGAKKGDVVRFKLEHIIKYQSKA